MSTIVPVTETSELSQRSSPSKWYERGWRHWFQQKRTICWYPVVMVTGDLLLRQDILCFYVRWCSNNMFVLLCKDTITIVTVVSFRTCWIIDSIVFVNSITFCQEFLYRSGVSNN